ARHRHETGDAAGAAMSGTETTGMPAPAPAPARRAPGARLLPGAAASEGIEAVLLSALALLVAFLLFGVGVWSANANISGAVISQIAELRVESKRKTVQHLEGGVVSEILVKNGDVVQAGDPLMRLDQTAIAANVAIIDGQLDELMARAARLDAEALDKPEIAPDHETLQRAEARPRGAELLEAQRILFSARLETLNQQVSQLSGRVVQTADQIEGAQAQIEALDRQLELIREELVDSRSLLRKGLIQKTRVVALEREEARLAGQRGAQVSEVAQLRGRIAEIELRALELRSNRREQAITELRDVAAQIAELQERRTSLAESLDRMEIRAPSDGVVHELAVNTVGGVVTPANPIMYVVPIDERLIVEARIDTASRDQVYPQQDAVIIFPGFNQRTTPQIEGRVSKISADREYDEATRAPYFIVEVAIPEDQLGRLTSAIDTDLVPGMPAEVHIQTGARSAASYLLRPLTDSFNRSLREE
ncbi:MAG: HlyD family type I secretion periplasmic adaptor subunit, partial [Pseudomonadota bacterium]